VSLQGNIGEFALADIFRLVGTTKKTGRLRVRKRPEIEGTIFFVEGKVSFAYTLENRVPLGLRLVEAGLLSSEELKEALRIQEEGSPERLGQILISRGYIEEGVLARFVQEQILDALFEIMTWRDGEFSFEPNHIPTEEDIGIYLEAEELISDANQRLVEWEELKKRLPSTDTLLQMSPAPARFKEDITLKPQEWRILYFLGEPRTIEELKQKMHLSTLSLYKILSRMLATELIGVIPSPSREKTLQETAPGERRQERAPQPLGATRKYIREHQAPAEEDLPLEWKAYYEKLNKMVPKK